jgi:serine phosphatase RsbU (regulator of sigma subunit)
MFATVFCAILDVRDGAGAACNCGHPSPFVLRRGGGRDRIASSGLPLGLQLSHRSRPRPWSCATAT